MRLRSIVAAVTVVSASLAAHADTLLLGSYGTGSTAPGGVANTSVTYGAARGTTYNIPTGNVWSGPVSNSSWVSFNPNTYPGGSLQAPDGTYVYQTTFTGTDFSSGSITILADDTSSIYLNRNLITLGATADPTGHCTVGVPNCLTATTYTLPGSDFVDGLNTLTFDVSQDFHYATGLDFDATVQTGVTPEPSSFLLLGTGLLGAAGVLKKRFIA